MEGVPPEPPGNPPTGGQVGGRDYETTSRKGGGRDEVTDSVTTPVTSSPESPGVTPPRIFFKLVGRLIDSGLLPQSPQFHWGVI
jgi:hypothetical protein